MAFAGYCKSYDWDFWHFAGFWYLRPVSHGYCHKKDCNIRQSRGDPLTTATICNLRLNYGSQGLPVQVSYTQFQYLQARDSSKI